MIRRRYLLQFTRFQVQLALLCSYLLCGELALTSNALASPPETIGSYSIGRVGAHAQASVELQAEVPVADPINQQLVIQRSAPSQTSRVYPIPQLEAVDLAMPANRERVTLSQLPAFTSNFGGKIAGLTPNGHVVYFTVDPELQAFTQKLVDSSKSPHVAIVVMEPHSGEILAIANRSQSIQSLALHAGFPAASLFKVVTSTAALENTELNKTSPIYFRGGLYVLERWNYLPDPKRDRMKLSLQEALGKSCNPVFGRVALEYLNPKILAQYVTLFGFNSSLAFDVPLQSSHALIPEDQYGLSRTAAGFGDVFLSPVHAAAVMSGIANGGLLPRPELVDRVATSEGETLYKGQPTMVRRMMRPETAGELLQMMENTTTTGTSRKEFQKNNQPVFPGVSVAAKTGTLNGDNPKGLNTWFIAAAPSRNPVVAISVIVVNPMGGTKASRLGKLVLEKALSMRSIIQASPQPIIIEPAPVHRGTVAINRSSKKSAKSATTKKVTVKKSSVKKAPKPAAKAHTTTAKRVPAKLKKPAA